MKKLLVTSLFFGTFVAHGQQKINYGFDTITVYGVQIIHYADKYAKPRFVVFLQYGDLDWRRAADSVLKNKEFQGLRWIRGGARLYLCNPQTNLYSAIDFVKVADTVWENSKEKIISSTELPPDL